MFIVCGTLRQLVPDSDRVHPIGGVVVIRHIYKDDGRPMVEVSGLVEAGTGVLLMTWEVDADRIV